MALQIFFESGWYASYFPSVEKLVIPAQYIPSAQNIETTARFSLTKRAIQESGAEKTCVFIPCTLY